MQTTMNSLIAQVTENVTIETVEDWGCCFTDISVRKLSIAEYIYTYIYVLIESWCDNLTYL